MSWSLYNWDNKIRRNRMGEPGTSDAIDTYLGNLPEEYVLTTERQDLGGYAKLYALKSGKVSGDMAETVEVLNPDLKAGHVTAVKALWAQDATRGGPQYFIVPGRDGEADTVMRLRQGKISDIKPDTRIVKMLGQDLGWKETKFVKM